MAATPHDAFFKAIFGQAEHAAGCFRAHLPAPLLASLDLSSATLLPGTLVGEDLESRHSDLLWQVRARQGPALVFLLFEHQRTTDPLMPYRLLEYAVGAWRRWLADPAAARVRRESRQRIPPVVPLVLHQGARRWTGPRRLSDLYGGAAHEREALRPWAPELVPLIIELSQVADEALATTALGRLALLLMKHIDAPDLVSRVRDARDLVASVRRESGLRSLDLVIRYILEADVAPVELAAALPPEDLDVREVVMSTAQRLREEGRKEGREEGELGARRHLVSKLLGLRFGALEPAVVAHVNQADNEALERYAERILTAATIDEVLAEP